MKKLIPLGDVLKFMRDYESNPKYKGQRLGQAFISEFDVASTHPEAIISDLYSKVNYFEARSIIFTEFVEL